MTYTQDTLRDLGERLDAYAPSSHPDDSFIVECLREAIAAAEQGNFGVGAVLVDRTGRVIGRGRNRVFSPRFRSDLHAEMDVVSKVERRREASLKACALYTSVECCPMCLARLVTAGVSTVRYAWEDRQGGMVHLMSHLPPVWRDLAKKQVFEPAKCSAELTALSRSIFETNVKELDDQLRRRR